MFLFKVEKKTEILENFKTAIGSTVKSISNSDSVEVSFGNQSSESKNNSIRLPEIVNINNKINFSQIRALADSKSLRVRFSNPKIFKSYEPEGNISKKLYKIAEKIRYEKLGSNHFKGVKNNIEKYYIERLNSLDLKSSEDKIIESFENYLRSKFFNTKIHQEIEKKFKTYKKNLNHKFQEKIDDLNQLTYDQAKYNELISGLIADMKLDESFDQSDKDEDNKPEQQKNPKNQEQNTKTQE